MTFRFPLFPHLQKEMPPDHFSFSFFVFVLGSGELLIWYEYRHTSV